MLLNQLLIFLFHHLYYIFHLYYYNEIDYINEIDYEYLYSKYPNSIFIINIKDPKL